MVARVMSGGMTLSLQEYSKKSSGRHEESGFVCASEFASAAAEEGTCGKFATSFGFLTKSCPKMKAAIRFIGKKRGAVTFVTGLEKKKEERISH